MLICRNCGTVHKGERVLPGSGWIELVLWLAYLVPGLIYSIWRRSSRRSVCATCGSHDLVDSMTPVGTALARQFYPAGLPKPMPATPPAPPSGVVHWVTTGLFYLLGLFVLSAVGLWAAYTLSRG